MHIRKNDIVEVIAGVDRGQRGKVLRVDRRRQRVVVEGVNRVYKHVRRTQRNRQGGRLSKEMPIHISNVMLIDPTTNEPTRVGVRVLPDGTKELYAKKSGATIRIISTARR
ncbi:MAG: 50S ribosomal protein L24 [Pirellulaceae bacterium]|nr:MAG: 50S ribosomal protein L24 [Pirellulaceae bacterium]